ncbi:unnamed protein product [Discosporangium mesarthrocarpum]
MVAKIAMHASRGGSASHAKFSRHPKETLGRRRKRRLQTLQGTLLCWPVCFGVASLLILSSLKEARKERTSKPTMATMGNQRPPEQSAGCASIPSGECWAGVYIDIDAQETIVFEEDGRVTWSPGFESSRRGQYWWRRGVGGYLEMTHRGGLTTSWSKEENIWWVSWSTSTTTMTGFVELSEKDATEWRKGSWTTNDQDKKLRLLRDDAGFIFPGCVYTMILPNSSWFGIHFGRRVPLRVVLHSNGSVVNVKENIQVATWSLQKRKETLEILLENSAQGSSFGRGPVILHSLDGGRTWLTVSSQTPDGGLLNPIQPFRVLSLELPESVTLFPVSPPLKPLLNYLEGKGKESEGGKGGGTRSGEQREPRGGVGRKVLEDIVAVYEGQSAWAGQWDSYDTEPYLVVITSAVPRPQQAQDLVCNYRGATGRAVWLSWSMVLCSAKALVPGTTNTVHISFQNEQVTSEHQFQHIPPPRHTRLAWPASESFPALDAMTRPLLAMGTEKDAGVGEMGKDKEKSVMEMGRRGRELSLSLSICTMFKNEGPYLVEWLNYHRLLGVTKVYMYDNGSTDESSAVLAGYVSSGFALIIDWPHAGAQTQALNDCLRRFGHSTRWMSFIDVDEFIDPAPALPIHSTVAETRTDEWSWNSRVHGHVLDAGHMGTRRRLLGDLLATNMQHTHCLPWVNYCAKGQLKAPTTGVLEAYNELEDMGERKIHMQKPLFSTLQAITLRMIGPHFLLYATQGIDQQYRRNLRCPYDWEDPSDIRIRHYRGKSLEEFVRRRKGADSAYKSKRYTEQELTSEWEDMDGRCK